MTFATIVLFLVALLALGAAAPGPRNPRKLSAIRIPARPVNGRKGRS